MFVNRRWCENSWRTKSPQDLGRKDEQLKLPVNNRTWTITFMDIVLFTVNSAWRRNINVLNSWIILVLPEVSAIADSYHSFSNEETWSITTTIPHHKYIGLPFRVPWSTRLKKSSFGEIQCLASTHNGWQTRLIHGRGLVGVHCIATTSVCWFLEQTPLA